MSRPTTSADRFLTMGDRIRVLPIIHGSGDCAIRVREELLARPYDCLAVPLPPSFQQPVEEAITRLPTVSAVVQRDVDCDDPGYSYVPIDPCQGVIAGLRTAMGERIPRAFIDMETPFFEAASGVFPDPYALKKVSPEAFAAAILPAIPFPQEGMHSLRVVWMAQRLRELEKRYQSILFVVSLLDWPWIRQVHQHESRTEPMEPFEIDLQTYTVDPKTLIFFLGELPYITGLYERGRRELTADDNLSIDGIKELVLQARDELKKKLPRTAQRITPQLLSIYFRYVRNLSLMERRLTPDLYTLAVAAQQTAGDDLALAITATARQYPFMPLEQYEHSDTPLLRMGIGEADIPLWGIGRMTTRLPGWVFHWRSFELNPQPEEKDRKQWKQRWNPFGQCSWPPEDDRIESFQQHVRDQAKTILGLELARAEKFTTSLMDGLDIRETLRNWHTGDLYVKIIPPTRGTVEVVVFLFDVPADPRLYKFRATWFAEHEEESTLAYFATDPMKNLIGPGIAQAEYGGAMFLFPPRPIPEIWEDKRLDFTDTLEERLLAAALLHSRERHVAIVASKPPPASWRRLAKRWKRKLLYLPLHRFNARLVERLRTFHVLNGKEVRSYAAEFIREG